MTVHLPPYCAPIVGPNLKSCFSETRSRHLSPTDVSSLNARLLACLTVDRLSGMKNIHVMLCFYPCPHLPGSKRPCVFTSLNVALTLVLRPRCESPKGPGPQERVLCREGQHRQTSWLGQAWLLVLTSKTLTAS